MTISRPRRKLVTAIAASAALAAAGAFADDKASCPKPKKGSKMIRLHTNLGAITLELFEDKAPVTVKNFIGYVESGFYDNTVFHRVIDGFMVQGGGFEPGMKQKATKETIKNEADNGLANEAYTVAMARTPDPHSASAQFFINVVNNSFLNFKAPTPQGFGYCVFGKVVEGKDIVDKIKKVPTSDKGMHQNVPVDDVVIEKAEVC
jgi:peptidyl-prolyl cis-trans isomerase B (cyclophilin B)